MSGHDRNPRFDHAGNSGGRDTIAKRFGEPLKTLFYADACLPTKKRAGSLWIADKPPDIVVARRRDF